MGAAAASGAAPITFTPHAKERRKQMGLTEHRILQALHDPHVTYPSSRLHPDRDRRRCYQRDDIVVIIDIVSSEIITILWHRAEGRSSSGCAA